LDEKKVSGIRYPRENFLKFDVGSEKADHRENP